MQTGRKRSHRMLRGILSGLLVPALLFGLAGSGLAQEAGAEGSGQAATSGGSKASQGASKRQELMAKYKRAQELQKELKAIKDQALENNPQLQEKKASLDAYMKSELDQNLNGTSVDRQRMQEIRQTLKAGDANMTKKEKQALISEYRGMRQEYRKAIQGVMQDKEVQKRNQAYRDEMLEAMKDENPKVESMLKELRSLQASLEQEKLKMKQRQMRRQQQQKMQQQGQGAQ